MNNVIADKASKKRSQLAHSTEVRDRSQDLNKSKSVKQGLRPAIGSKDSKDSKHVPGKSGMKKVKPNEHGPR